MALSFTQLSTYRSCPRQYEYCYVKKVPRGISEAEAFGAAVHSALKKWGEKEMKNEQLKMKNRDRQLEMFTQDENSQSSELTAQRLIALWHSCCPTNVYKLRVEADAARARGEELMHGFFAWWQEREREVVAVEKGFSLVLSPSPQSLDSARGGAMGVDVVITGRFDRIERTPDGLHIIDFKTSRPRTQIEADADLQLSIYALACKEAYGALPVSLSFLHLTEDGVVEVTTARNESQVRDAIKQIASIEGRIGKQDFAPTPSVAQCKRCPYRGVCSFSAAASGG